jgi:predicted ATPase
MVLVGGEAGVGKTRLVAELAAGAQETGALVATGACVELTAGTAPYLAATEVLRDLARVLPERAWDRLRAGAGAELAPLLPGSGGAPGGRADDASRARLFGQVHDLLSEAAATAPLMLVLEDIHWADRSTLDLTAFVARALRDERILLVGTFRSDEVPTRPALRGWLAELGRATAVRRLELEPFTEAEVGDLIAAILGTAADPATAAAIAHRSGGNAFLAEELLAAAGEDDPAALPASVRDVLDGRIAVLPPDAQAAVRAAAVAGARVDDELLAELVELPDLATALREAVAQHVLVTDARDGRLSFRHELAREAAYAGLLPGERRQLHGACARVLTERPALGGEAPAATSAAIANHWHAAASSAARWRRVCGRARRQRACTRSRRPECSTSARWRPGTRWTTPRRWPARAGSTSSSARPRSSCAPATPSARSRCSTPRSSSPTRRPTRCARACCTRAARGRRGRPAPPGRARSPTTRRRCG